MAGVCTARVLVGRGSRERRVLAGRWIRERRVLAGRWIREGRVLAGRWIRERRVWVGRMIRERTAGWRFGTPDLVMFKDLRRALRVCGPPGGTVRPPRIPLQGGP